MKILIKYNDNQQCFNPSDKVMAIEDFRDGMRIKEMQDIDSSEDSRKRAIELADEFLRTCRCGRYSTFEIRRAIGMLEESLQNIPLK